MIICQCAVVRCEDIRDAVDLGARTVNAVCGATGAGRGCGGCVFTIKRVMCEHRDSQEATPMEVPGEAS